VGRRRFGVDGMHRDDVIMHHRRRGAGFAGKTLSR